MQLFVLEAFVFFDGGMCFCLMARLYKGMNIDIGVKIDLN